MDKTIGKMVQPASVVGKMKAAKKRARIIGERRPLSKKAPLFWRVLQDDITLRQTVGYVYGYKVTVTWPKDF